MSIRKIKQIYENIPPRLSTSQNKNKFFPRFFNYFFLYEK